MAISRRRVTVAGALLGALLLLSGGCLWAGDGGEPRTDDGLRLRDVCEGVLPEREARAVLDDGPLTEGFETESDGGSLESDDKPLLVGCSVVRVPPERTLGSEAARITVTLHGTSASGRGTWGRREEPYPATYVSASVPLTNGWTGFFALSDAPKGHEGVAVVFLDCAGDGRDLLVAVRGKRQGASDFDDPAHRTVIARLATATARGAAERWGCEARFGERLRTVPLPVAEDEDVPLGEADGTCEGVPARGRALARAWESARGGAPQEQCAVGNSGGTPLYALRAFYGPYADSVRTMWRKRYAGAEAPPGRSPDGGTLPDGGFWATADCPAPFAGGPALFAIEPLGRKREKPTEKEEAYERAALKAFAEASAEHHGCSAPNLP